MKVPKRKSPWLEGALKAYKAFEKTHPCKPLSKTSEVREDLVNSPQHYQGAGMEVWDVLRAFLSTEELIGYCRGNMLKYELRYKHKGGLRDLEKSSWYGDKLKKLVDVAHSSDEPIRKYVRTKS